MIKLQPILIQFIFFLCIVLLANCYHYNIPIHLADIKVIFILSMCYLMSHILYESVGIRPNKEIVIFSSASLLIPLMSGFLIAYYVLVYSITNAVIMGLVYSVVAVPVLYIYLKELGYSSDKMYLYLQSAIAIDLFAWIVFALLDPKGNWLYILLCLSLGLIPLIFKNLPQRDKLVSMIFFILFLLLEYYKFNGLLFAIVYLFMMRLTGINFLIVHQYKIKENILKHIVVPVIILYGLLQINFDNVTFKLDWILLSALIIFPILSKWIGSYLAFIISKRPANLFDSVILNTRGLTEIVFLNMAKQAGFLTDNHYFYLILMSLFSTIIPGFLIEYKKYAYNTRNS